MRRLRLSLILLAASLSGSAFAQGSVVVPLVTIYPRETIRGDMLEKRETERRYAGAGVATDVSELVGKVSRTTLLPGRVVALDSVETPRLVTVGARVRLVFHNDGVVIFALGTALESGGEGDVIRVRNSDSKIVVTGSVRKDGSVDVGSDG